MAALIRVVGERGTVWMAAPCGCAARADGSDEEIGRVLRALILHVSGGTPCEIPSGVVVMPPETAMDEREIGRIRREFGR